MPEPDSPAPADSRREQLIKAVETLYFLTYGAPKSQSQECRSARHLLLDLIDETYPDEATTTEP